MVILLFFTILIFLSNNFLFSSFFASFLSLFLLLLLSFSFPSSLVGLISTVILCSFETLFNSFFLSLDIISLETLLLRDKDLLFLKDCKVL